jgi:hypothetical protein
VAQTAPVVAKGRVEIATDPEKVWEVLAAVDRWPTWNPDVKSVVLTGPVAEGTQFRWKAGPGTINSTFLRVERPRLLSWKGRTLGIHALHSYELEGLDGVTVVRTEESWDGLLARVLRGRMQKMLESSIYPGLRRLKVEAERRSRGEAVPARNPRETHEGRGMTAHARTGWDLARPNRSARTDRGDVGDLGRHS